MLQKILENQYLVEMVKYGEVKIVSDWAVVFFQFENRGQIRFWWLSSAVIQKLTVGLVNLC